jgi:hypothetical protein
VAMLTLNENAFNQAIEKIGLEGRAIYPYKELLTSEISYINYFLFYLNDEDVQVLLSVYETRLFRLQNNEMTQDQLRLVYIALKELREQQLDFMKRLYDPSPQQWLQCLFDLNIYYQQYFKLSLNMVLPKKVDLKFREIQAAKMKEHYPQLGTLSAVLIAPIQRLPRYLLLGREILKAIVKQEETQVTDKLLAFKQALIVYMKGISFLTQEIDTLMEEPLDFSLEEPSSPYFQPSGKLHGSQCKAVKPNIPGKVKNRYRRAL